MSSRFSRSRSPPLHLPLTTTPSPTAHSSTSHSPAPSLPSSNPTGSFDFSFDRQLSPPIVQHMSPAVAFAQAQESNTLLPVRKASLARRPGDGNGGGQNNRGHSSPRLISSPQQQSPTRSAMKLSSAGSGPKLTPRTAEVKRVQEEEEDDDDSDDDLFSGGRRRRPKKESLVDMLNSDPSWATKASTMPRGGSSGGRSVPGSKGASSRPLAAESFEQPGRGGNGEGGGGTRVAQPSFVGQQQSPGSSSSRAPPVQRRTPRSPTAVDLDDDSDDDCFMGDRRKKKGSATQDLIAFLDGPPPPSMNRPNVTLMPPASQHHFQQPKKKSFKGLVSKFTGGSSKSSSSGTLEQQPLINHTGNNNPPPSAFYSLSAASGSNGARNMAVRRTRSSASIANQPTRKAIVTTPPPPPSSFATPSAPSPLPKDQSPMMDEQPPLRARITSAFSATEPHQRHPFVAEYGNGISSSSIEPSPQQQQAFELRSSPALEGMSTLSSTNSISSAIKRRPAPPRETAFYDVPAPAAPASIPAPAPTWEVAPPAAASATSLVQAFPPTPTGDQSIEHTAPSMAPAAPRTSSGDVDPSYTPPARPPRNGRRPSTNENEPARSFGSHGAAAPALQALSPSDSGQGSDLSSAPMFGVSPRSEGSDYENDVERLAEMEEVSTLLTELAALTPQRETRALASLGPELGDISTSSTDQEGAAAIDPSSPEAVPAALPTEAAVVPALTPTVAVPSVSHAQLVALRSVLKHATTADECRLLVEVMLAHWGVAAAPSSPVGTVDERRTEQLSRVYGWLLEDSSSENSIAATRPTAAEENDGVTEAEDQEEKDSVAIAVQTTGEEAASSPVKAAIA